MIKRRLLDAAQNIALVALTITAVLLIARFPMLEGVLSGRMKALLAMPVSSGHEEVDLSDAIAAVHLVVTDEMEYGRFAVMNALTDGAAFQSVGALFREAIGSSVASDKTTEEAFRAALDMPGIYLDLVYPLPMETISAWLGEELDHEHDGDVRALALVAMQETTVLFLYGADGTVVRCVSALSSAAVKGVTAAFSPNGGRFAYESGYETLAPYTILTQEISESSDLCALLPGGYTAYNLLSALDFNAHTNARYTESSGVEVVMQSPRTLRVGPDGTVAYRADGEVSSALYHVPCTGDVSTAAEALEGACRIAAALSNGTGAAPLALETMRRTADGWEISFHYHQNGVKIYLPGDKAALRVVVSGDEVVEFEYCCRAYALMGQSSVLLPPSVAVAIASLHEGAELKLAYMDNGTEILSARWFAE